MLVAVLAKLLVELLAMQNIHMSEVVFRMARREQRPLQTRYVLHESGMVELLLKTLRYPITGLIRHPVRDNHVLEERSSEHSRLYEKSVGGQANDRIEGLGGMTKRCIHMLLEVRGTWNSDLAAEG